MTDLDNFWKTQPIELQRLARRFGNDYLSWPKWARERMQERKKVKKEKPVQTRLPV